MNICLQMSYNPHQNQHVTLCKKVKMLFTNNRNYLKINL